MATAKFNFVLVSKAYERLYLEYYYDDPVPPSYAKLNLISWHNFLSNLMLS